MDDKKLTYEDALIRSRMNGLPTSGPVGPVTTSGPTVNVNPLGMSTTDYQGRMDALKAFSQNSPELQYQRDSAVANRIDDPVQRQVLMAKLSEQRIASGAAERLQAMKLSSDEKQAETRALGNIKMAELNATGKDESSRLKEIDTLNDAIYTWQQLINDQTIDPVAKKGYIALRENALNRIEGFMGKDAGAKKMTAEEIATAVQSGDMTYDEGASMLRKMGYE